MKTFTLVLATVLGFFASTSANADLLLGIANSDAAFIRFVGNGSGATVTFTNNSAGNSFDVTSVNGVTGGGGLVGSINVAFSYSSAGLAGGFQQAPLSGSGQLVIGTPGDTLTATISGVDIFSAGLAGGFNAISGLINITNAVYGGSNSVLTQFAAEVNAGGGVGAITYNFDIGQAPTNLSDLAAAGSDKQTTYSGTLSTKTRVVPEPGTFGMALSGVTLLSLGYYRQRRRQLA